MARRNLGRFADALARVAESAGISLVEMAVAFVVNHPAVTSAIIGPRTMNQLESQSARPISSCRRTCSSPDDGGYEPSSLTDARLGRR